MAFHEASLKDLKNLVEDPDTGVAHMGSWNGWHWFYFSNWAQVGDVQARAHGSFRCKDLILVSESGEAVPDGAFAIAHVISVDLKRRIVEIDLAGAHKALKDALGKMTKESPSQSSRKTQSTSPPLPAAPAANPGAATPVPATKPVAP